MTTMRYSRNTAAAIGALLVALWLPVLAQDDPALADVRERAEQGDAGAQFNLGVMYENGQGAPQDHAEALRWYPPGR